MKIIKVMLLDVIHVLVLCLLIGLPVWLLAHFPLTVGAILGIIGAAMLLVCWIMSASERTNK